LEFCEQNIAYVICLLLNFRHLTVVFSNHWRPIMLKQVIISSENLKEQERFLRLFFILISNVHGLKWNFFHWW